VDAGSRLVLLTRAVLRADSGEEAEFVVVNLFASLEAAKRFAGDDYAVTVFEP